MSTRTSTALDRIQSVALTGTELVTSHTMQSAPEPRKKLKNVTWVLGQKPCKVLRQANTFAGRHTTHYNKPL